MLHEKDGNSAEEETQLEKVTPDSEAGYTEVTQIRSEGDGFKVKLNMCADIAESAQAGHMTKDEEYVSEQEAEHHTADDDDERLEEQERSEMEQERSEMEQERSEMEQERSEMEQERSEMEQERSEMEQERSGMERGRAIEVKEFHKEVERQRRIYLEQPALESETRFERRSADDIETEVTYHNTRLKTDYNTGLLTTTTQDKRECLIYMIHWTCGHRRYPKIDRASQAGDTKLRIDPASKGTDRLMVGDAHRFPSLVDIPRGRGRRQVVGTLRKR